MIELFEQDIKTIDRQSSKGNQLKWRNESYWYKADYTGYEGIVEYIVSKLITKSTLHNNEITNYEIEEIQYKRRIWLGCKSINFLPEGWQLITLERLFHNYYGHSLQQAIYKINGDKERLEFLVNQTIRITGLTEFGQYMNKLLTIDAIFLNEDRHTHNIAVLLDSNGEYQYCPIFDNGASLLSDIKLDYPLDESFYNLIETVKAKTFSANFDDQLDASEELYGKNLRFHFTKKDVSNLLKKEQLYSEEVKKRIEDVLFYQMDKYQYLFSR